ncbi:hypothetical protein BaRGS_00009108 [Batillaria attramentaria]|uniref:Ig-like domain-containing protein n=1 Tax=Batillaria attramentaria TaxID=370345 RepID=A0ABD0LLB4_9CAEN
MTVNADYVVDCIKYDPYPSNWTLTWTLLSPGGQETELGSCTEYSQCISPLSPNFTAQGDWWASAGYQLSISQVQLSLNGSVLRCKETGFSDDQEYYEDEATCTIGVNWVDLQCDEDGFSLTENNNHNMFCRLSGDAPVNVTWTLVSPSGQQQDLGNCTDVQDICVSPLSPYMTLSMTDRNWNSYNPEGSFSLLSVDKIQRETTGTLVCTEHYGERVVSSACSLDVVCNDGIVAELEYEVPPAADDDDDDYSFPALSKLFDGRRPFYPTPFITTDGKQYYRGFYTYTWPVPSRDGHYVYFSEPYPGPRYSRLRAAEEFTIVSPSPPAHNCSSVRIIAELGHLTCTCSSLSMGQPPGRLIWYSGDVAVVTGEYGVSTLRATYDVDRQDDGKNFMCQLDWAVSYNASVSDRVAYGPDSVEIQQRQLFDADGSPHVIVTCVVTGVNPLTSDMITWGGLCQGQQGLTCTVTSGDDGKEVTCTVTNPANDGHSATSTVALRFSGCGPDHHDHPPVKQDKTLRDYTGLDMSTVHTPPAAGSGTIAEESYTACTSAHDEEQFEEVYTNLDCEVDDRI